METRVRVSAPAKLNLHLRVYGRRADGFHGIRSLFQAISLADELRVRSLKANNAIEIAGGFDCPPEATTLHKAIIAFREATGDTRGVAVEAIKAIPAGAGLGGGSSDAASLLRALDALCGTRLGAGELADLGARVGSDVPFFVNGGCALVAGRGELLEPFPSRGDLAFTLVFPGFPVGTAWAYALLDRERPDDSAEPDPEPARLLEAYRGPPSAWPFANSFEPPVTAARPEIARIIARLRALGAAFAAMSGSGSTAFGVFDDPDLASEAAARLRGELPAGSLAARALPLARPPTLD